MKYIIVKGPKPDEKLSAIVFPIRVMHKDVARIHRASDRDMRVVGAGFCSIKGGELVAWGKSESLRGMASKPGDVEILKKDIFKEME